MFLKDERETILNYDPVDQMWHAWTNIPAHMRKLEKAGWSKEEGFTCADNGQEIAASFTAPKYAITFRDLIKAQESKNRGASRCFPWQRAEDE